jgi:hypothetical protein
MILGDDLRGDGSVGASAMVFFSLSGDGDDSSFVTHPGLFEEPYLLPALPYVVNLFFAGKPKSARVAIIRARSKVGACAAREAGLTTTEVLQSAAVDGRS